MAPERLQEWRDIAVTHTRTRVLRSYFRNGFDGSGSDGGSCIGKQYLFCFFLKIVDIFF